MELLIRPIESRDNAEMARIIRAALTEFGANKPGTVFFDPTTDDLTELFKKERSVYYVAEQNGILLGGAGIYPTEGLPERMVELVKMYLRPDARGKGLGEQLVLKAINHARECGYATIYLESMPELKNALGLYEKLGFRYLDGPLGESGHFGCDRWMLRDT